MSIPFVMPRSGQNGLCRFVRRTSCFPGPTTSVASPSAGIRTFATKKFNHEDRDGHVGKFDFYSGSSFGGRCPWPAAPAYGTDGSSYPALTPLSHERLRLLVPGCTKTRGVRRQCPM